MDEIRDKGGAADDDGTTIDEGEPTDAADVGDDSSADVLRPDALGGNGYVVAIRRDSRDSAPADWIEQILAKGAVVVGGYGQRAQIKASSDVADRIRVDLGDYLQIEPVIEHRTQTAAASHVTTRATSSGESAD
jgi:hypothetical protein